MTKLPKQRANLTIFLTGNLKATFYYLHHDPDIILIFQTGQSWAGKFKNNKPFTVIEALTPADIRKFIALKFDTVIEGLNVNQEALAFAQHRAKLSNGKYKS